MSVINRIKQIFNWQVIMAVILISLSAAVYALHYYIFRDSRHIFIYMIGDLAFVFVEVLLVAVVLHRLLTLREKKDRLKKLNMVIGVFYTEVGTDLMKFFSYFDKNSKNLSERFINLSKWSGKEFLYVRKDVMAHTCALDCKVNKMQELKKFLGAQKGFLVDLLANPTLLEHETFTDLLWAAFHLTEELSHRQDFDNLPESDYEHLAGDIKRVYTMLILEWLSYMKHLRAEYPYLFSLALRTNPFNPDAAVVVKK